jgi:hypothetical protein
MSQDVKAENERNFSHDGHLDPSRKWNIPDILLFTYDVIVADYKVSMAG